MVKKKASLAGRGAEILFGPKGPPVPEPLASDSPSTEEFESNQQGDIDTTQSVSTPTPTPLNIQSGVAPIEVSPDRPAPVPPVLPPGTVINVNQPLPTAMPVRTYDIPPPSDLGNDQVGDAGLSSAPRATVPPPPRAGTPSFGTTPTASPISQPVAQPTPAMSNVGTSSNQPAPLPGGNVSNPSSTPPSRGTSVVSSTSAGPQAMTPVTPSPVSSTPSAPPLPSGNGKTASPAPTSITPMGGFIPTTPTPIPVPPSISTAGMGAQPLQGQALPISDLLRVAAQAQADRQAALDAAQKTKEQFQVDPATVKELRATLFKEIDELYKQTCDTVCDSPQVANFAFEMLKKARLNLLSSNTAGDLSDAEFYIERVRSKISRSQSPVPHAEIPHVRLIWLWQFVFFVLCLPLATVPFITTGQLTLFGITIPPDFIPLFAAAGWGGVGGVIGTLYNLTWFVQIREYDPAYNLDYVARPIKGFIAGGILFLVMITGVVAVSGGQQLTANSNFGARYALIFLIAVLGGFKQEYVFELFDELLKVFLRQPPKTPAQIDPSKATNK